MKYHENLVDSLCTKVMPILSQQDSPYVYFMISMLRWRVWVIYQCSVFIVGMGEIKYWNDFTT